MSDKIKKILIAVFFFLLWSLIILLILRGSIFRYGLDFEQVFFFIIIAIITYLFFALLPVIFIRFLKIRSQFNKQKQQTAQYIIKIIIIIALISAIIIVLLGLLAMGWIDYCDNINNCIESNVCYYKVVFNPLSYYGLLSHQCVPVVFKYAFVFKMSIYLFIVSFLYLYISYPCLLFYYALLKLISYIRLKNKKKIILSTILLIIAIIWLVPVLFSSFMGLNVLYCSGKNMYQCDSSVFCSYFYNRCYPFYLKIIQ